MPTTGRKTALHVLDDVATAIGILLLAAMAALGPIAGALNGMRSDACTSACRYDLVGLGTGVWMIGPAACLLGATVLLLKRSRSGRPLAWICGVALALQLGVALLGDALISAGVR